MKEFFKNHFWAMDFTCVIDLKLFQIFILGIINHKTRELIYIRATLFPTQDWLTQQFRNIAIDEIPFPDYLIIDNDGIYGKWIDTYFNECFEIKILRIARGSPWQNGQIESFFKTLKFEPGPSQLNLFRIS